jgi:hypothetical protein
MAKLGYLYLNDGVWDGQQVVPADWVSASVRKQIQVQAPLEPWDLHLGYAWWLHQFGAYAAHGMGGQFIFVVPDLDMVVALTGGLAEPEFVQAELLVKDLIMAAAISSEALPENPAGVALLQSRIQAVEQPEPQPVPRLPQTAQQISGKTYTLEHNLSGLRDFSLSFQEAEALLKMDRGGARVEWLVGLDNVFRITPTEEFPPVSAVADKGVWRDARTFFIEHQYLGSLEELEVSCHFDEDAVTVHMTSSAGWVEDAQGKLQD